MSNSNSLNDSKIFHYLPIAIQASIEAGQKIMEIYFRDFSVDYKEDKSPLTAADTAANEIINQYLIPTNIHILSEEGKSIPFEERKKWKLFWMVDPLDGTKEFIKRNGEFTVNIAMISNNLPIMGVIYIPVSKTLYFGCKHCGSIKIDNICHDHVNLDIHQLIASGNKLPLHLPDRPYTIVGSKSHLTPETKDYIEEIRVKKGKTEILSRGSSLKICMIAEGAADIYPRFAPTMEWDIAAGHAIAKFAGASIINYTTGKEFTYNTETLVNPWFIAKR
ncbi:MAG: 3'(2'),5'-bisphosphate nucleotidase CysQ [Bacteroidales bacterium]|nr:3'(2'),5'-bisphosphate nucleotidase CysQ [Bacteroidales bacterium]MCF8405402.1 3'(2'),5'-bisphosphate nucleotidase CysQ [Bacteroidales bacterium]